MLEVKEFMPLVQRKQKKEFCKGTTSMLENIQDN